MAMTHVNNAAAGAVTSASETGIEREEVVNVAPAAGSSSSVNRFLATESSSSRVDAVDVVDVVDTAANCLEECDFAACQRKRRAIGATTFAS